MERPERPVYTTLASYLAALETHGATAGDIPLLIVTLRATVDSLDAARVRIAELEAAAGAARPPMSEPDRRALTFLLGWSHAGLCRVTALDGRDRLEAGVKALARLLAEDLRR
jgi:hypothetical protein